MSNVDEWSDKKIEVPETQFANLFPKLDAMFRQQSEFMELLKLHRKFTDWPVDITTKAGQQACRDASLGGIEEWFEALKHLKNWKSHRVSDVNQVDRAAFLLEMCDSLHYFIEVLLLAGISEDELYDAYMKKGDINKQRIIGDY